MKPELECFDTGHTHGVWPLLDMGLLKPPLQFSFIVNVLGGIPPLVESLQLQTKIMPRPASEWEVIGISKCQWRMLATALVLGGNVRVGLEDNLYLPDGDDGEVERRARRGRGAHGARRGAEGRRPWRRRGRSSRSTRSEPEKQRVIPRCGAYAKIKARRDAGHVETITLSYPERRNAIGPQMTNELLWALHDAREADDVRRRRAHGRGQGVLRGGGLRADARAAEGGPLLARRGTTPISSSRSSAADKPVVAQVNGHAMGGGLGLVAACTFAIARERGAARHAGDRRGAVPDDDHGGPGAARPAAAAARDDAARARSVSAEEAVAARARQPRPSAAGRSTRR